MTKDEEIKRLTEMCANAIDRNGKLNRKIQETELELKKKSALAYAALAELEEKTQENSLLESDNQRHIQMFDRMQKRNMTLEDVNYQLSALMYNVIGMLSKQNAEDVREQLNSLLNRSDYDRF